LRKIRKEVGEIHILDSLEKRHNLKKQQQAPRAVFFYVLLAMSMTGCFTSTGQFSTTQALTAPAVTLPSTVRAAQIIFTTNTTGGSFNAPGPNGTAPGVGKGVQAVRVFNPDGTLLAQDGPTGLNWPTWLQNFEIGISGSSNSAAINPNCARFGTNDDVSASGACVFPNPVASSNCGVTSNYRVSEADCGVNTPTAGNGTDQDGIYFRAVFNRNTTYLGAAENIMAVVNYSASTYNAAPANPSTCFSGGVFSPELCSDFTWKVFVEPTLPITTPSQPFMMMIPPAPYYVNGSTTGNSAANSVSKQFIIPLASNQSYTTVQFSRILSNLQSSNPTPNTFTEACDPGNLRLTGTGANTPLCAGLVVYSITFYRI
jgi:hypothetical protein